MKEKYADYQEMETRPELRDSDKESIKESLIQRFETCYDTLWRHLHKYFEDQGQRNVPTSPKPLSRLAHESNLMDAECLERLFDYIKTRIGTTHDYNMEKAEYALSQIGYFIADTTELYERMTE